MATSLCISTACIPGKSDAFPLTAFLTLYHTGAAHTYCDYMLGTRLLIEWLGPVEKPPGQTVYNTIPWYACNYELDRLAVLLDCRPVDLYYFLLKEQNKCG